MNKLEDTNLMIDYVTEMSKLGINVDNTAILLDIAKSLAMIADKLCRTGSGVKDD